MIESISNWLFYRHFKFATEFYVMTDKKAEESSKLLSCCVCNITVHARCYGVLKEAYSDDATKKWKCEVCASKVRKPVSINCSFIFLLKY